MKIYVMDPFAIVAYARKEKGWAEVRSILAEANEGKVSVAMSIINLGEVFYMLHKKTSPQRAIVFWRNTTRLNIALYAATTDRTLAAAQLKTKYSTSKQQLSYADCFAAALAQELNATIVTGDPEFQTLSSIINIQFLPK